MFPYITIFCACVCNSSRQTGMIRDEKQARCLHPFPKNCNNSVSGWIAPKCGGREAKKQLRQYELTSSTLADWLKSSLQWSPLPQCHHCRCRDGREATTQNRVRVLFESSSKLLTFRGDFNLTTINETRFGIFETTVFPIKHSFIDRRIVTIGAYSILLHRQLWLLLTF